jgi:hypothetical protein
VHAECYEVLMTMPLNTTNLQNIWKGIGSRCILSSITPARRILSSISITAQEEYGRCQPWGQGCFVEGYIASI